MQLTKFNALVDLELRASDPICAVSAGFLAYYVRFDTVAMNSVYSVALVILLLSTLSASAAFRVYDQPIGERPVGQYCRIAASWSVAFAALIALGYLLKVSDLYSRGWVSLTFILGLSFMALVRVVAHRATHLPPQRFDDTRRRDARSYCNRHEFRPAA